MTDSERIRSLEIMIGDLLVELHQLKQVSLQLSEQHLRLTKELATAEWNAAVAVKKVEALTDERDWWHDMYDHEKSKNA